MVQIAGGGSVVVTVGDQILHEYQVDEVIKDNVKAYTCIIEAKEGDSYQIRADAFSSKEGYRLQFGIFVDGNFTDQAASCLKIPHNDCRYISRGLRYIGETGNRVFLAYTFGKMEVTSERLPEDVTQQELENASNIRVEITHKRRVGGMNHIPKVPSGVKLPEANVVPQGSKPARLGLSTCYGQEIVPNSSTVTCCCTTVDDLGAEKVVVTFKYRRHEWLVGQRIKDGGQFDEDDVAVPALAATATIEKGTSLSKRNEREEDESGPSTSSLQARRIRIKRELQDQLEAVEKEIELYGGVKVEEEEQKRITAECMRKIGGKVVVIEDD